ncbi:ficolin-2-like [Amphiura filiformis]|uniref:ficolin-2-like n=1 Tax=Amphiura filiformis TaxID=82378 RepID=UPI003B224B4C
MDWSNLYLFAVISVLTAEVVHSQTTNEQETIRTESELEELPNQSAIKQLVDMVCQCKIEEECGSTPAPAASSIDPLNPRLFPRDCYDILELGQVNSDLYDIYPIGVDGPVRVYCDMTTDGGGWTVFQRREDATVDFYQDWQEYKIGFGSAGGNFWLGNENLHHITNQGSYELRIELSDFDGASKLAKYDHFRVGDETSGYILAIGSYSGNAGDGMTERHHNSLFSTKDRENDTHSSVNCPVRYKGGWWYGDCYYANLNGVYLEGADSTSTGIVWAKWRGAQYSLKRVEMKTRPVTV